MPDPGSVQLEYPCAFPIKAFGKAGPDFPHHVMDLLRPHVADLDNCPVKSRPSRNGRFQSLTVTITATGPDQIAAINQALSDSDAVLMSL